MLYPRMVGFDENGKAVGAGFSSVVEQAAATKVMMLPSNNVDFIDLDVRGMTEEEIRKAVKDSGHISCRCGCEGGDYG